MFKTFHELVSLHIASNPCILLFWCFSRWFSSVFAQQYRVTSPPHDGQYIECQIFLDLIFLKLCFWLLMSWSRFTVHLVHVFYCVDAFPGDLIRYSHIGIDLQHPIMKVNIFYIKYSRIWIFLTLFMTSQELVLLHIASSPCTLLFWCLSWWFNSIFAH